MKVTNPPVAMAAGFAAAPDNSPAAVQRRRMKACENVRQRILDNAMKTGKEALKPTTMAIRMVESALATAALSEQG